MVVTSQCDQQWCLIVRRMVFSVFDGRSAGSSVVVIELIDLDHATSVNELCVSPSSLSSDKAKGPLTYRPREPGITGRMGQTHKERERQG